MQTYTAKAKGKTYTMTAEDVVLTNGGSGLRLTCTCPTHEGTSGAAHLSTPTTAADFPKDRIHGHVTMAHSPIGSRSRNLWKA